MLEWMRTDPIAFFRFMLYRAPAVLIALTLHEISHGYTAWLCGDSTAHDAGRLSLNPFRHLSLLGTLMMFTVGMGWAKPVPVSPANYRHGKRDDFLVSAAGVAMNFILFSISTALSIWINEKAWYPQLFELGYPLTTKTDFLSFSGLNFAQILYGDTNILVREAGNGYFSAISMAEFLQTPWLLHLQRFLYQFSLCNLGMCIFNLLPFPPLDGFHVFNDILLGGRLRLNAQAFRVSMLALLILMNMTSFISRLISFVTHTVQSGILMFFLILFRLA